MTRATLRRRLAAALACPLSLLLAVAATTSAYAGSKPPGGTREGGYAALGDSFASGVGAGESSGDCRRSPDAYPALWADAHPRGPFDFAACSGANIDDVITSQLPGLSPRTTLVSITVGGIDVGFSDVMKTCVMSSESSCLESVARAEQAMDDTLPGDYDVLLRSVQKAAPRARVVVLGYPHLYADRACLTGLVTQRKQSALNAAADHLDHVIADRARAHTGVAFADVRPAFAGHGICSDDSWINPPSLLTADVAYHPTARGQLRGYLPALEAAPEP
ncbi:SGNH/GDSL hydrolase family protein [Streptomyces sp. CT34]|uniref:SGNH/GDSL hydrolase family protein n=1 Tax=Streptomyces sp. CT34 TaxID=1553907 RepID=UPI0024103B23|nr:SGNH/GDSL hydrolase family protein [Streptomyces sp. CT34]